MTESLMKFVHRVRIGIYIVLCICIVIMGITHFVEKIHADEITEIEAFWPPDMVPHPMPPENLPKDDEMS